MPYHPVLNGNSRWWRGGCGKDWARVIIPFVAKDGDSCVMVGGRLMNRSPLCSRLSLASATPGPCVGSLDSPQLAHNRLAACPPVLPSSQDGSNVSASGAARLTTP
ncbi:hypothetical protein M8818_003035 [Zalaria obscura]|uniref:Uncharacterized protein n=1 Tax=Zalaria obscura TaxID=2024903 RepID=A0ACC3SFR1_9PEZI